MRHAYAIYSTLPPWNCIHSGAIAPFSWRIGKLFFFSRHCIRYYFSAKGYMENATPFFIFIASCGVFFLSIFILLVFFDRCDSDLYSTVGLFRVESRERKNWKKGCPAGRHRQTGRQMKFKKPSSAIEHNIDLRIRFCVRHWNWFGVWNWLFDVRGASTFWAPAKGSGTSKSEHLL